MGILKKKNNKNQRQFCNLIGLNFLQFMVSKQ